ncbi:hypothetical protein [Nonomuraea sp. NPDC050783]|uniref:hypothetical protein n=1 Tax=Nonomuraea sp. NPDC050783 TaxID=3154634 RepID=UPI003466BE27
MTGLLIGAIFGAVFVVVNAHEPLNGVLATVLRVAACLAAAAVVALWLAAARERPAGAEEGDQASGQEGGRADGRASGQEGGRADGRASGQEGGQEGGRADGRAGGRAGGAMYGRGYLAVVAAEAVLLFGGLRALAAWGAPEQANVAWIALVVGGHFVVLAPIWRSWDIAVPGALLAALGIAGLALAWTPMAPWVPLVSGVLSGVVLLAGSLTMGRRTVSARAA